MKQHKIALATLGSAAVLALALGAIASAVQPGLPLWHAEFCALANAVTDGCDIPPRHNGYLITTLEYLLVVPLFGATFSLFTSALAGIHIRDSERRVKAHVESRLKHHLAQGGCPPPPG